MVLDRGKLTDIPQLAGLNPSSALPSAYRAGMEKQSKKGFCPVVERPLHMKLRFAAVRDELPATRVVSYQDTLGWCCIVHDRLLKWGDEATGPSQSKSSPIRCTQNRSPWSASLVGKRQSLQTKMAHHSLVIRT